MGQPPEIQVIFGFRNMEILKENLGHPRIIMLARVEHYFLDIFI
jgi:hypothetical protein